MKPRTVVFLVFFLLPLAYSTSAPSPAPMAPTEDATEFVRFRCNATLYSDLCFASLARYAGAIGQSPVALARVATNITLPRLRALRSRVAALRSRVAALRRSSTGRVKVALRDCVEQLSDAADEVKQTGEELRELEEEPIVGKEAEWHVSNAQTWMSAALTYENTCCDGFKDVGDGGGGAAVATEVCGWVEEVKEYTSNALALVNGLVDDGQP